jgi:hypothetical protein
MKSMGAHTAKLQAENYGRTQKIQNTSSSVTTGIYRGVAGCGPRDFQIIIYPLKRHGYTCSLLPNKNIC